MKFGVKLGKVNVSGVEISGIEFNAEVSMSEVRGLNELAEATLKKLPEYFEDLAAGFRKFTEIDREMREEAEVREVLDRVEKEAYSNLEELLNEVDSISFDNRPKLNLKKRAI